MLPFTDTEFFQLFAVYNRLVWPAVVALWIATIVVVFRMVGRRGDVRFARTLLVIHWAWSGAVYHWMFFTTINPAAWLFGAMFVLQAVLVAVLWPKVTQLQRGPVAGRMRIAATSFLIAAVIYPFVSASLGHSWPAVPLFAVPCPTTLFTAGILLWFRPGLPKVLYLIPALWSLIGGSAVFAFGVWADLALFPAAAALLGVVLKPRAAFAMRSD
jgi:hypothetical protein